MSDNVLKLLLEREIEVQKLPKMTKRKREDVINISQLNNNKTTVGKNCYERNGLYIPATATPLTIESIMNRSSDENLTPICHKQQNLRMKKIPLTTESAANFEENKIKLETFMKQKNCSSKSNEMQRIEKVMNTVFKFKRISASDGKHQFDPLNKNKLEIALFGKLNSSKFIELVESMVESRYDFDFKKTLNYEKRKEKVLKLNKRADSNLQRKTVKRLSETNLLTTSIISKKQARKENAVLNELKSTDIIDLTLSNSDDNIISSDNKDGKRKKRKSLGKNKRHLSEETDQIEAEFFINREAEIENERKSKNFKMNEEFERREAEAEAVNEKERVEEEEQQAILPEKEEEAEEAEKEKIEEEEEKEEAESVPEKETVEEDEQQVKLPEEEEEEEEDEAEKEKMQEEEEEDEEAEAVPEKETVEEDEQQAKLPEEEEEAEKEKMQEEEEEEDEEAEAVPEKETVEEDEQQVKLPEEEEEEEEEEEDEAEKEKMEEEEEEDEEAEAVPEKETVEEDEQQAKLPEEEKAKAGNIFEQPLRTLLIKNTELKDGKRVLVNEDLKLRLKKKIAKRKKDDQIKEFVQKPVQLKGVENYSEFRIDLPNTSTSNEGIGVDEYLEVEDEFHYLLNACPMERNKNPMMIGLDEAPIFRNDAQAWNFVEVRKLFLNERSSRSPFEVKYNISSKESPYRYQIQCHEVGRFERKKTRESYKKIANLLETDNPVLADTWEKNRKTWRYCNGSDGKLPNRNVELDEDCTDIDYNQITIETLKTKYKWPFPEAAGVYWPVLSPSVLPNRNTLENHINQLLSCHSYSGYHNGLLVLTNETSDNKAVLDFNYAYIATGKKENSLDEWNEYNSTPGRFSNRKQFKIKMFDQDKEEAAKKNHEEFIQEIEFDEELYTQFIHFEKTNNEKGKTETANKIMAECVESSRIDNYSMQCSKSANSFRHPGQRLKTVPSKWTSRRFDGFRISERDKKLIETMKELLRNYDKFYPIRRNVSAECSDVVHQKDLLFYPELLNEWCYTPMIASLYYQVRYDGLFVFNDLELKELNERRKKYDDMLGNKMFSLKDVSKICKMNNMDKRIWTIIYDQLTAHFKNIPSLAQLMENPDMVNIVNDEIEAIGERTAQIEKEDRQC